MEVHPRIRQRIRQNWVARDVAIQSCRNSAVAKLNTVLSYLRGAIFLSEAIDIDDLITEIENVRSDFISFRIDAENPSSIRDAIVPRINQIHDKLKQLELEQNIGLVATPPN